MNTNEMPEIKIRVIQPSDNPKVARMIRSVFEEYKAKQIGTVYSDPTTDNLHTLFQQNNSVFFIAEKADEILGCCGIFPTSGLPTGCAELVKFYVSGKVRGTGVGRLLYQKCEEWAIDAGYTQLYIESMPDFIQAVHIYEKIGFKMLDKPLGNSGHFGCDIWMLKSLKN